ncbi:DUF2375 domain-containing protein [Alginatibacterium sediminis]|uniref:DUF2375 domain-containing protein n=2 Tax=Alginatibacterium sediminis TaxID=2164068 RepID=A0A420ELJ5_9ALTE|nr:DUF2375 domain-containing protein [Alginatibacterium sediminis]
MDNSLELFHKVLELEQKPNGRVVVPESFKRDKSIIAICDGKVEILNRIGDRNLDLDNFILLDEQA